MALELNFKISDNTVNRYGFRVLTEGIKTDNFMNNPVALVGHSGEILSVGKWKNLSKNIDGTFTGMCEFDEEDDTAKNLFRKNKAGYMSAVSMSVDPMVESDDPKDLLPGQKYPTVMESDLLEISFCNIPGNANAVKLIRQGKEIQLSLIKPNQSQTTMEKEVKTVEQLQQELTDLRKTMAKELVYVHKTRGVIAEGEQDFFERSANLDYDGTKKLLDARKNEEPKAESSDKAKTLVELHFNRGAIPATEKAQMEKVASLDYDGTKAMLEARKGTKEIDLHVVESAQEDSSAEAKAKDPKNWKYLDYYKNDLPGLLKMKIDEPAKYKALHNAHMKQVGKDDKVDLSED